MCYYGDDVNRPAKRGPRSASILTGLKALLEPVEVGGAARDTVDAHLVNPATLHLAHARAYYKRNVALLASGNVQNTIKNLRGILLKKASGDELCAKIRLMYNICIMATYGDFHGKTLS